jgi:hypothetical protein
MAYFILVQEMNTQAEELKIIFMRERWRLDGILAEIISDRYSTFTSNFWKSVIATYPI